MKALKIFIDVFPMFALTFLPGIPPYSTMELLKLADGHLKLL